MGHVHLAAIICSILLLFVCATVLSVIAEPEGLIDWVVLSVIVGALLILNMFLTLVESIPEKPKYAVLFIALIALSLVVGNVEFKTSIPENSMKLYKLGHFYAKSMVFKKPACNALKHYNLKPIQSEKLGQGLCLLTDVQVLSRLGKNMYLQREKLRFTISSADVVTWSVDEPQKTNKNDKDKKPESAPESDDSQTAKAHWIGDSATPTLRR